MAAQSQSKPRNPSLGLAWSQIPANLIIRGLVPAKPVSLNRRHLGSHNSYSSNKVGGHLRSVYLGGRRSTFRQPSLVCHWRSICDRRCWSKWEAGSLTRARPWCNWKYKCEILKIQMDNLANTNPNSEKCYCDKWTLRYARVCVGVESPWLGSAGCVVVETGFEEH